MKNAVVYARYSCDSQTEQSIEGQLRVCQEYAEKHNIQIVETYIDRAISGTTDNRPDFKRMLKDSDKKLWNYVLVYKFDRFSRNKYESVIHKKHLKDNGISVVSAMENIPDTPEGIILESLLEGLNQYYSAELSQKVKRGMRETRLKGNYQGGNRPYGYDIVNHKLVINDEEAKIVQYVFKKYSLGVYGEKIANLLNARGCRYKDGKKFNRSHIYHIISHEYFTGMYNCNTEYYCDVYPPIISRNLYKKVESMRNSRKYGKKPLRTYMYRVKIYCKKCGKVYYGESGTSKCGKVIQYYKCKGKKRDSDCDSITYRKEYLEAYLTSYLTEFITNDENLALISNVLVGRFKQKKNLELLNSYEHELKRCKSSLENILKAIEEGIDSGSVNDRVKVLENRIKELEAEIYLENNKENVKYTLSYVKNHYKKALKLESFEFVNYLVNKIVIDDTTLEIYLERPYFDNYTNYDIIKKEHYEKVYKAKFKSFDLSRDITVFI